MADKHIASEQLIKEIDAEVKRISKAFRFILKYREQFQPSGIEFSDLRAYTPSDDANRIDWRSSARLNDLYVKEYEEEQDMDVFVILDVSDSMEFGTAEKLKREYCTVMASTLAYASVDTGINVGLGMFGDEITFLPPAGGQKQYQKILMEVTNQDNHGGTFDLEEAIDEVMKRVKENTYIFIISDFIDFAGGEWKPKMKVASARYRNIFTLMVRDLRDYKLPRAGNVRFESPDGSMEMVANTNNMKKKFEEEAAAQEKEVRDNMEEAGADFLKIDTRDSFAAEMLSFFDEGGALG